jgi:hypothetical protein
MALPPLTSEQRSAVLEKAAAARRERATVKNRLKYVDGKVEVYRHTAAGWAAVRRQYPSRQVHAWLGPVPA